MKSFLVFTLILFVGWVSNIPYTQQCGVPTAKGRIVGGVDSGGYHYPWFALLLLKQNSKIPIPICGGSLITNNFVLTAAHCFTINPNVENKNLFAVALGVYDICDDKETTREIFNAVDVFIHEMYQRRGKFYDIALIKLERPAPYTVVCLPNFVKDVTELALLIGFGATKEDSDSTPCHMLEVNVTKYSKMDCMNTKLPTEDKKEPSVICAGTTTGNADSCYGDSGGPLLTRNSNGNYEVVGIVSYGYGCGTPEVPGIYTNVGSYLQWIANQISQSKVENMKITRSNGENLHGRNRLGVFGRKLTRVEFPSENVSSNFSVFEKKPLRINMRQFESSRENKKRENFLNEKNQGQENIKQKSKVIFPKQFEK